MKTSTLIFSFLFLAFLQLNATNAKAEGGHSGKKNVTAWSSWELAPNADIYYRVELTNDKTETTSKTVQVEFLNTYKKQASFCFALNDTGIPSEVSYKPVLKLKKNKSIVAVYPRPKSNAALVVSITSLELGK